MRRTRVDFNTVNPSLSTGEGFADPLPVEMLMGRECPYLTKTREVLGNASLPPLRFPSTLSGLRKSLGPRGWIFQYLPVLVEQRYILLVCSSVSPVGIPFLDGTRGWKQLILSIGVSVLEKIQNSVGPKCEGNCCGF